MNNKQVFLFTSKIVLKAKNSQLTNVQLTSEENCSISNRNYISRAKGHLIVDFSCTSTYKKINLLYCLKKFCCSLAVVVEFVVVVSSSIVVVDQ